MEKKVDKKFTWVIKNFSSLKSEIIFSDKFDVRGCKWRLSAYPKGYMVDNHLSLSMQVVDYGLLPSGWRRHVRYLLIVVNQLSEKLSQHGEIKHWFDEKSTSWGIKSMIPLNELHAKDSGFLVNGELKIVVELDLLKVIGKVVVNGIQLLPSQVELMSTIFEKYPEIATDSFPKNPKLRTGCISLLLGLVDTSCQSPQELRDDHLDEAFAALKYLTNAGFKLDWLEKKLKKIKLIRFRCKKLEKTLMIQR